MGLKRTPLYDIHKQSGAHLVDFAGWEMPLQYTGVLEEHMAVRTRAGLFDVSHMGEIVVKGPGALTALQRLTPNDVSRLVTGQAHYSALTTERGTPVDDLLVYRISDEEYLLCVNAANDERDFAWVRSRAEGDVSIEHASDRYAQLALQGPLAASILQKLTGARPRDLGSFRFVQDRIAGREAMIARTGYTGEDGFELLCAPGDAGAIWKSLFEAGATDGLLPAGLAARDTLRLEASLPLYGNDIDEETTLLEAGLGFIVKLDKGPFLGRDALARQKEAGLRRRLVGFEMVGRGIARHGYHAFHEDAELGDVRSGTYAPFLRKNVGTIVLPIDLAREGQEFDVMIRAKRVRARVVRTPFYRRARTGS